MYWVSICFLGTMNWGYPNYMLYHAPGSPQWWDHPHISTPDDLCWLNIINHAEESKWPSDCTLWNTFLFVRKSTTHWTNTGGAFMPNNLVKAILWSIRSKAFEKLVSTRVLMLPSFSAPEIMWWSIPIKQWVVETPFWLPLLSIVNYSSISGVKLFWSPLCKHQYFLNPPRKTFSPPPPHC